MMGQASDKIRGTALLNLQLKVLEVKIRGVRSLFGDSAEAEIQAQHAEQAALAQLDRRGQGVYADWCESLDPVDRRALRELLIEGRFHGTLTPFIFEAHARRSESLLDRLEPEALAALPATARTVYKSLASIYADTPTLRRQLRVMLVTGAFQSVATPWAQSA
jgi:hypothetical protein